MNASASSLLTRKDTPNRRKEFAHGLKTGGGGKSEDPKKRIFKKKSAFKVNHFVKTVKTASVEPASFHLTKSDRWKSMILLYSPQQSPCPSPSPSPTMVVVSRVTSTRAAFPRTSLPTLDSWGQPDRRQTEQKCIKTKKNATPKIFSWKLRQNNPKPSKVRKKSYMAKYKIEKWQCRMKCKSSQLYRYASIKTGKLALHKDLKCATYA